SPPPEEGRILERRTSYLTKGHPWPEQSHIPKASRTPRSTVCSRPSTRSTPWCCTPPSAPARPTRTTRSSPRACWSSPARSWTSRTRRSRSPSRCARSTRTSSRSVRSTRRSTPRRTSRIPTPRPRCCSATTPPRSRRPTSRSDPGPPPVDPMNSELRTLAGARVLVGVGGGIAAYKTAHLVRGLVGDGADVRVVPTRSSLEFVGAATWEALSHHPVLTSVFEDVEEVAHVRLGQEAELVVIAPATADRLAGLRMGRADDLLAASAPVTRAQTAGAPAMHTEMRAHRAAAPAPPPRRPARRLVCAPPLPRALREHPSAVESVPVLRGRGLTVPAPADGRLTGPDSGPGRLPEPEAILDAARAAIAAPRDGRGAVRRDLVGRELLITAGGTREDLDPVRFLANHSSGRQGWALAHAALVRGARVRLAAANVELVTPPGARRLDVGSAAELADLVAAHRG